MSRGGSATLLQSDTKLNKMSYGNAIYNKHRWLLLLNITLGNVTLANIDDNYIYAIQCVWQQHLHGDFKCVLFLHFLE